MDEFGNESENARFLVVNDSGQSEAACPQCPVAGACGACQHVNQPYAEQLAAKDARMRELFADAGLGDVPVSPIEGAADPYHYRGKVMSPFVAGSARAGAGRGKAFRDHASQARSGKVRAAKVRAVKGTAPESGREILTGMYAAHSHQVIPVDHCLVEDERGQQVVRAVRSIMLKHGIEPYDEDAGAGFMRHVVVRVGHESGEVLVTLVTNADVFPSSKAFCRELVKRCPFVTSIVQNVNTRKTNVVLGQREQRLYGPGFILDTLCGLSFRISSQSFYQVTRGQTAVLYEQAMQFAQLSGTERAIDAYCGTGTIGLVAAKRGAASVLGVDSVEAAIRDARENARHNGIEHAQFVAADAGTYLRQLAAEGETADVVFMDPPRAGSTEEFLDALAVLAPKRVVYVSCNPATQVRDLCYLAGKGYAVRAVQPVDMFPHTDHIESVALAARSDA